MNQILPLRAQPLACVVTHERHSDGDSTSIARLFDPAEIGRCRRCRECRANAPGLCPVTIPEDVPDPEARLFSLTDRERARGLG